MVSRNVEFYNKRREQGLCTRCGNPAKLKSDGTPACVCENCAKKKNKAKAERRKLDKAIAKEFKKAHINFEDLKIYADREYKPTIDARICTCDGVYYPEYSFCPWCGRKVK